MTPAVAAQPGARPAALPRRTARDRFEALAGIGFAMPAFLRLILTHIGPLLVLLALSFTNYELGAVDVETVGLQNFRDAVADTTMRTSLGNTFLYVAIVVPASVLLSLFVAILVYRRTRSRGFYEVVYFLPVTTTLIAMASM